MKTLREQRTILAIDPASDGLAFAVFESGELLDFGHRTADLEEGVQLAVIDELLDGYAVDLVVLEDGKAPGSHRRARVKHLLGAVAKHVRLRGLGVVVVARKDVHAAWRARGISRKEAVAAAIAERFPDLEPLVPPKRKLTMSEDRRVNIFDAVSLALQVFGSDSLAP